MAKILVIDDEPGIVRFVHRALEADGHTVHTASDGAEGLRVAAEVTPGVRAVNDNLVVRPAEAGY